MESYLPFWEKSHPLTHRLSTNAMGCSSQTQSVKVGAGVAGVGAGASKQLTCGPRQGAARAGTARAGMARAGTAWAAVPSAAARDPHAAGSGVPGGAKLGCVHDRAVNGAVPLGGAGRAGNRGG